jgi:cytochrome c553
MVSRRLLMVFLTGLWIGTLAAPAFAQPARARATAGVDLQARLKEAQRDPKLSETLFKTGRKVAAVCDNCHGASGNSPKPDIPNLASLNPVYHLEQLRQYANGLRRDPFMEGMIKVMNSDEKVGMVLFYADQKVTHKPVTNPALVAHGKAYYEKACMRCHDEDGHGDEKVARVAGQQSVYLRVSLQRYRAGSGVRMNPDMAKVAQKMTDADIEAVVAYAMSMD